MNAKIKVYIASTGLLSILLTLLRVLSLLFCFDYEIGYFDNGFLPMFTDALTLAGVLWCLSPLVFIPRDTVTISPPTSPTALGMTAVAATLVSIAGVLLILSELSTGITLKLFCGVFLLLGSPYLWGKLSHKLGKFALLFGTLLIVGIFFIMFSSHFDVYVAINSPAKNALQLVSIACALMTLGDLRFLFGDGMPRYALACRLLTVLLLLPAAATNLVLFISDKIPTLAKSILSPLFVLPLLGLAVYAAVGLFLTHDRGAEKENEEI